MSFDNKYHWDVTIGEEILHRLTIVAHSEKEAIDKAKELLGNVDDETLRNEYDYTIPFSEFQEDQIHAEELL